MSKIEIASPRDGARVSSPLAVVKIRYSGLRTRSLALHVGESLFVLELEGSSGEVHANVTLVEGDNRIHVAAGQAEATSQVHLPPSRGITITAPGAPEITTRATAFEGSYEGASCPAGVISVNGFLQQFAVPAPAGRFAEAVVLRPGANHLAVQVGELYTTRIVRGAFEPARILATLVWDTNTTDLDLYVKEPSEASVWYGNKAANGTLDVDRTGGYGPENYSIVASSTKAGDYGIRVHYYGDRGLGRSEWTVRVITDEGQPKQRTRTFYGILDRSLGHQGPGGQGADWNDVCSVHAGPGGALRILAPGES